MRRLGALLAASLVFTTGLVACGSNRKACASEVVELAQKSGSSPSPAPRAPSPAPRAPTPQAPRTPSQPKAPTATAPKSTPQATTPKATTPQPKTTVADRRPRNAPPPPSAPGFAPYVYGYPYPIGHPYYPYWYDHDRGRCGTVPTTTEPPTTTTPTTTGELQ